MSESQALADAAAVEQAGAAAGLAKQRLDAAEQELAQATRIGARTPWLIAFGVLMAATERYLEALRAWAEALSD